MCFLLFFTENLVRGLDDDEAGFLDFVDQTKLAEELRILQEERDELEEYRKAVAKENEERLRTEVKSIASTVQPTKSGQSQLPSIGVSKESQKSKLNACVVKRKNVSNPETADNSKKSRTGQFRIYLLFIYTENWHAYFFLIIETPVAVVLSRDNDLKCIAILPGIGCYETSDSDSSAESVEINENQNNQQFDLCGRPIS